MSWDVVLSTLAHDISHVVDHHCGVPQDIAAFFILSKFLFQVVTWIEIRLTLSKMGDTMTMWCLAASRAKKVTEDPVVAFSAN